MAQTAVDIVVKVVGDQKLKQLDTSLRGTAANSVKAATGLDRSAKSARNLGSQARRAEPAVSKLGGAIRGLVTAAAVLGTAKFVIGKTAELETQTRSLQVLTGELAKAEQIIGRLQKFAAVTPFTSSELIETSKRLAAFGVDTEKLVETTKRLADVSGATGAALDGVATAYGQIVAKGRLQGEELLQLQERGIGIQEELQKMYGLTGEEFRKALEKGKISAAAVELAIKRLTAAGGKYADGAISQSDTLAGKFSTLQDGIENLARTIGSVLSPAIKFVLDQAIQAINMINKLIGIGQKAQKFGLDQAAQKGILDQARREAEEIVNLRNIQDPFERNRVFQEISAQRESDLLDAYGFKTGKLQVEIEPVITENNIPELLQQTTKTGSSGSSGGGTSAADTLTQQLQAGQQLAQQFERNRQLREAEDQLAKDLLQTEFDRLDVIKQIQETAAPMQQAGLIELANAEALAVSDQLRADALKEQQEKREAALQPLIDEQTYLQDIIGYGQEEADIRKRINELMAQAPDLDRARVEEMVRGNAELSKQAEIVQQHEQMIQGLAQGVASDMTSAVKSVIDGTKDIDEAFADMLKSIANRFLDMAMKLITDALTQQLVKLFSSIFSAGTGATMGGAGYFSPTTGLGTAGPNFGLAEGGFITKPTQAMIAEAGEPEYAIPASKMSSAMSRYNAGMRGEAVVAGASEHGRTEEGAMGSGSGNAPINVNYSGPIMRMNNDDYVKTSELPGIINQSAKAGEARALGRLRTSVGVRRKLGMS